jgi:hypothetical protein
MPAPDALSDVVHSLGGRILAFEFARGDAIEAASPLERAVLRCARDLRELLMRAAAQGRTARSPHVRALDVELARTLRDGFAWVTSRLDQFVATHLEPSAQTAPTPHAWFNVPRAIDDAILALIDLCAVAGVGGASTADLALTLRRLRGAMHRLSLLTTTVV